MPFFAISSSCVPVSAIIPFSITTILSAWRTVLRRCATIIGGLPLQEFLQFRHDSTFIVCIQSIGGFIKENIMRFLVYSPGYKDTLLLPLTQPMPFLAYFCVIPHGK